MKALSKCYVIKPFIEPTIMDLIKYLDHHGKYVYYSGSDIHDLYYNLDTIGYPTTLTYQGYYYHYFDLKTNT